MHYLRAFLRTYFLKMVFIAVASCLAFPVIAQLNSPETRSVYTQKAFPVIGYLRQHPKILRTVQKDSTIEHLTHQRSRQLSGHLKDQNLSSLIGSGLNWDKASLKALGDAFVRLYLKNPLIRQMTDDLKASHFYALSERTPDTTFLRAVWAQTIKSLQYIQNVYFLNGKTTYGKIDSSSITGRSPVIMARVKTSLHHWVASKEKTFYTYDLEAALLALQLNERDEAIRYEPITGGMNSKPAVRVKNIDFSQYTYSCLLVPGLGPEIKGEALSEGGKQRCKMAAEQFQKKGAPFIIVSGGHVHPFKTPYCEAVEMKKFMVDSLAIADSVVIIEPYARHTTTNLRNANRLISLLGIPFNKPVLIVTDSSQSAYINKGMTKVAMRDLGYLPYRHMKSLTPVLTVYYPEILSFQTSSLDPLDP